MNEDRHKSWSNFIFIILTGHQLPNFNQTFRHFKILTKPSFRISTKIKLHNLNQASAAKYWSNFSFKILPELQLQNLYQTLYSKSEQSLGLAFSQARVRSIKSFTNVLFLVDIIKDFVLVQIGGRYPIFTNAAGEQIRMSQSPMFWISV